MTVQMVSETAAEKITAQPQNSAINVGAANNNAAGALDAQKTAKAAGDASVIRPSPEGAPKPTVSHMLGELTWLMSQSPTHKHFTIGDLEWLVMPAVLLEQFRVFHGDKHPLGFALWAYLSEDAEKKLNDAVMAGQGARLRPDEWKSGGRLWLVDLVAPFATPENKLNEAMLADLIENVFKGEKIKLHLTDPVTGKREMKEIGG
jgi:cytolysin-activating lysine-acyltransferase